MRSVPGAALHSAPSSPHVGRIEFSCPRGAASRGYFACVETLELDGEERSVDVEMIGPYRADMLGFFEELAEQAAGWSGEKPWESESAEMRVTARNSGDGVTILEVWIRQPPTYEEEHKGILHVRSGELPRFDDRIRAFLRMERGERFTRR